MEDVVVTVGPLWDLAKGLPDAANTMLGIAGGVFGSVLSLVTLSFLALLAVPFAAVFKIVLREAGRPRRDLMAAVRAAEEPLS